MSRFPLKGASKGKSTAYIGLGSNLGNRREYINAALEAIDRSQDMTIIGLSGLARTRPVDNLNQPDFLNQVIAVETSLSPAELLTVLQAIEKDLGRRRVTWKGPRTIDLDILLYDNLVMEEPDLTIPHPELTNRSFFLRQIVEIDSNAVDPVSQRTLRSFFSGEEK